MGVEVVPTDGLAPARVAEIRALLDAAFGDRFGEDDWAHALGGTHVLAVEDGTVVAHGAVVERTLYVAGRPWRTGYVEAVATLPARQRGGLAGAVMREVAAPPELTVAPDPVRARAHCQFEEAATPA